MDDGIQQIVAIAAHFDRSPLGIMLPASVVALHGQYGRREVAALSAPGAYKTLFSCHSISFHWINLFAFIIQLSSCAVLGDSLQGSCTYMVAQQLQVVPLQITKNKKEATSHAQSAVQLDGLIYSQGLSPLPRGKAATSKVADRLCRRLWSICNSWG